MTVEHIQIAKELEWVRPYLEDVAHLVRIDKLKWVRAVKADKNKIQWIQGSMTENRYNFYKHGNAKKPYTSRLDYYGITLFITGSKTKKLKPLERMTRYYSKIDILQTLAHELAHFDEPEFHTPQHKLDECLYCTIFMERLKGEGYKSEEYELKHDKPNYPK